MNYLEFRNKMFDLACFNTEPVYAWQPSFDRNNLWRWTKKGLLIRLRQGWFTFPEYKSKPEFALYFANRIYTPSYISLHSALAFYGMIPEAVVQITSVTPLKTAFFRNFVGEYSYKTIKQELMFGYTLKTLTGNLSLRIADPEKAILDLLYLYPELNTEQNFEDLRLDEDFLHSELNMNVLLDYAKRFYSKVLILRVERLISAYSL